MLFILVLVFTSGFNTSSLKIEFDENFLSVLVSQNFTFKFTKASKTAFYG